MFNNRLLMTALFLALLPFSVQSDTAITYQGQLQSGGEMHDGEADMEFRLFDSLTDGSQIGSTIVLPEVAVDNGLFQVELDFGEAYSADSAYLEITVAGETLSPRQRLTTAPRAAYALSAPAPNMVLDDLDDVGTAGAQNGDFLQTDGSRWFHVPESRLYRWDQSENGLHYDGGNVAIGAPASPGSLLSLVGDGSQALISAESLAGDTKLMMGSNGGLSIGSGMESAPEDGFRVMGDAVFEFGNVGIGIQSEADIEKNLHLIHDQYTGLSQGGLAIENVFNNAQWVLYSSQSSSNLSLYFNNGLRGVFDSASGNYVAISDRRLKANVTGLDGSLDKIMQMQPKEYEFRHAPGERYFGLLAQNLEEVLPEVVSLVQDDGTGQGDLHAVSYSELVPVLIAGMQEQQATIEALREELEALKDEVESIGN